ncbi:ATP-grasp fold amidoligase family protein [Marivita geojedonensis]|uniref:ATP-grasp fold amidoligase family protein n=1 Tax=Marivita geojedonensis TaxID=1123756 RepID=UPI000A1F4702|nr:ATP-grasp fold amidoligase family protein [Marivita geojedonensis]PRY71422.1 teichuronopeptide biosynthesis TupA-like protein [Marivita geojedonensis]
MKKDLSKFELRQIGRKTYDEIYARGLFGSTSAAPSGTLRGIDVLPSDIIRQKLNRAIQVYYGQKGVLPNLIRPSTFFEKLTISKFFAPIIMPSPADKLNVSAFVPDGLAFKVKTIDVMWEGYQPITRKIIDSLGLPQGKYYAKSSGGTGRNIRFTVPLTDKDALKIEENSANWLIDPHGVRAGEWWYDLMRAKNFIEADLSPNDGSLTDWKFHCGGGEILAIQVDHGRHSQHTQTLYDADFKQIPEELFFPFGPPEAKPIFVDNMILLSKMISRHFEFVRVDLYHSGDTIFVGELTLAPMGGQRPPNSYALDKTMGSTWPFSL